MPNHITNVLKASNQVLESLKGSESLIDFNSVVPMPQELIVAHVTPVSQEMLDNEKKFGYASWHPWSCEHWGTKWNAYESIAVAGGIQFDTAWSPPHIIIGRVAQKFPKEKIEHIWADEDIGNNCGVRIYQFGKMYEPAIYDPIDFALEITERTRQDYGKNPKTGLWEYIGED